MPTRPRLLLVDDDPLIGESLAFALEGDYEVTRAQDRAAAVARLREGLEPDLALIDLGLPPVAHLPNEGFKLIGDLLAHAPRVRILVLTGQNEDSNARRARALGAVDLVPKPCEPGYLRTVLARALKSPGLERPDDEAESARSLIGDSPAVRRLRSQIDLYASAAFPALIAREPAVSRAQLRGDLALAGGADALWLRQGCLHRRGRGEVGLLRGRRRGHALPGRDRRAAARAAGEAPARAGERRIPARGRDPD